jgi:D-beta-D-heptose 7-phosphate kinase / D-beta-D-heptose 1-phosphate adenosyltransferase
MSRGPLVVIGDALLDIDITGEVERLSPDAHVPVVDCRDQRDRPGGAGLAAVIAAERLGCEVVLVASVGDDPPGARLAALLRDRVDLVSLPLRGHTPQKIRIRTPSKPMLRLDVGDGRAAPIEGGSERRLLAALRGASAVLVSDYGRGTAGRWPILTALEAFAERGRPVVWDPHPAGTRPLNGARLATPNENEARHFAPGAAPGRCRGTGAAARRAIHLSRAWHVAAVAVTMGAKGVLIGTADGAPVMMPAPAVDAGDTCGAGDCFAVTAACALAAGLPLADAVAAGVRGTAQFLLAGAASRVGDCGGPDQRPGPYLQRPTAVTEAAGRTADPHGRHPPVGPASPAGHAGPAQEIRDDRASRAALPDIGARAARTRT